MNTKCPNSGSTIIAIGSTLVLATWMRTNLDTEQANKIRYLGQFAVPPHCCPYVCCLCATGQSPPTPRHIHQDVLSVVLLLSQVAGNTQLHHNQRYILSEMTVLNGSRSHRPRNIQVSSGKLGPPPVYFSNSDNFLLLLKISFCDQKKKQLKWDSVCCYLCQRLNVIGKIWMQFLSQIDFNGLGIWDSRCRRNFTCQKLKNLGAILDGTKVEKSCAPTRQ